MKSHATLQAMGWMTGALFSFTIMAVSGRELSYGLNTFQIMFFRSVASLIIVAGLLCWLGWHQTKTEQLGRHITRNVIHFSAQYAWLYGVAVLPLAQVFAIEFTTPIWVCILAIPMLGEKLTRPRAVSVLLGFIGVLIVIRPGAGDAVMDLDILFVMWCAVGFALTNINTKRLVQNDTPITIMFYMALLQMPLGFVPSLDGWVWPTAAHWPWIFGLGAAAMSAHYCFARALKVADSGLVAPMDFLRLPLIAVVGYLVYNEAFDLWIIAGAAIIVVGNIINIRTSKSAT
jgi:drug/metabolite transporter (DMT)-like permease